MLSHMGKPNLEILLRALCLPGFIRHYQDVARQSEKEGLTFERFLYGLCEIEIKERKDRKIESLIRQSKIPKEKTLAAFKMDRMPAKVRSIVPSLCEGEFLKRRDNVLAFGLPGTGKSHLLCGIAHELVRRGHSVYFTPTHALVQRLLAAKRDLRLTHELSRLERIECILLDDIGYVQQSREEMEVFFTFLAERYERRSLMITSNLVFSKWDQIFKDPMTTAAAIDRVIHHSIILEMNCESYREEEARQREECNTST